MLHQICFLNTLFYLVLCATDNYCGPSFSLPLSSRPQHLAPRLSTPPSTGAVHHLLFDRSENCTEGGSSAIFRSHQSIGVSVAMYSVYVRSSFVCEVFYNFFAQDNWVYVYVRKLLYFQFVLFVLISSTVSVLIGKAS